MDYTRTATAHDYDANKTNIIVGKLDYVEGKYIFTPDVMSNARVEYVHNLFLKGIDTKIFVSSSHRGSVCRLIESTPTYYICEALDISTLPNIDTGTGTSLRITNSEDTFDVEFSEF